MLLASFWKNVSFCIRCGQLTRRVPIAPIFSSNMAYKMGNTLDPNFKAERDARMQAEYDACTDPATKALLEKKLQLVADIEATEPAADVESLDSEPMLLSADKPTETITRGIKLNDHFRAALGPRVPEK